MKTNGWLGGESQNKGGQQREVRWLTPAHITDPLGQFDLDPAGAPDWQIADRTYTPENGDDGLTDDWFGRVWLNPPYGKLIAPFMERMAKHGNGVALVFARTETRMWHEWVWPYASGVFFLKGRLFFHDAAGIKAPANAGAPSCLIAYGEINVSAIKESGLAGVMVRPEKGADQ